MNPGTIRPRAEHSLSAHPSGQYRPGGEDLPRIVHRVPARPGLRGVPVPISLLLLAASVGTAALFLVEDIEEGYFDKLRATPVARSAIVLGRLIVESVTAVIVTIASGPVGFVLLV